MVESKCDWQAKLTASDGKVLNLSNSEIERLPSDVAVRFRLDLSNCRNLRQLPNGLTVGTLVLEGCTSLRALPEELDVSFLDISGCAQISEWPSSGKIEAGRLRARHCTGLKSLPTWMTSISQLDVQGCTNIGQLPTWLSVSSWIDLADTGIRELPRNLADCALRWKGVPIDERIAFQPESIHGREILDVENAELRRVMLERVGFERFLKEVDAETLDTDRDTGGTRQLLRVEMTGDEPLVCVSVFCPSTSRQYIIRVPPKTKTCHQAIAWTAGFDDPSLYRPLVET